MVISRLNIARIIELLKFIEHSIDELKEFTPMSKEDFLSDKKNPPYVESYLRRALEAVFDTGRHILAKTHGFKDLEYKAIAKELGNKGIVTKELAEKLYLMAGYRNRMVHFYKEIKPEELFTIVKEHLKDIEEFINEINSFIKEYRKLYPEK